MYSGQKLNKNIKQVAFVVLLVAMFILIVVKLNYFASSFLGAFTIYMLLRNLHRKLLKKGCNKMVATLLLLIATILIVFVIGGVFFGMIYSKLKGFNPQIVFENINAIHATIIEKTGYDIFSKDIANGTISSITSYLPDVLSTAGSIFTNGLMMVFLLFFMLQESSAMESGIQRNLPLSSNSIFMLKKETQNMVVSNAIGIPVIMIGQGVFAGLAYWFLGAGDSVVWGVLTGLFGLIPIVGTAGIWVPLSINLLLDGYIWQGIALLIYGALIISSVDNLIRMVFLKRYAKVHPVIAIFGIILGLNLFGFWGIIFGPLVISGFMVLFRIYKNEFLVDQQQFNK